MPRSSTKQYEQQVEANFGPVIGFYTLSNDANQSYAGMGEWPGITLPIRQGLMEVASANEIDYDDKAFRLLVHPYDVARVLDITRRLTTEEAISYAARIAGVLRFDSRDGQFIPYIPEPRV